MLYKYVKNTIILGGPKKTRNGTLPAKCGCNNWYQLWAVIPLSLSMRILDTRNPLLAMRIDKVKWITAHNCGKPNWHLFTFIQLKRENLGLDFVSQNVSYKTNYWTKLGDLGIIFLRRSYLIHWSQLLHPYIVGSMPFCFFSGPPCIENKYVCKFILKVSTERHERISNGRLFQCMYIVGPKTLIFCLPFFRLMWGFSKDNLHNLHNLCMKYKIYRELIYIICLEISFKIPELHFVDANTL